MNQSFDRLDPGASLSPGLNAHPHTGGLAALLRADLCDSGSSSFAHEHVVLVNPVALQRYSMSAAEVMASALLEEPTSRSLRSFLLPSAVRDAADDTITSYDDLTECAAQTVTSCGASSTATSPLGRGCFASVQLRLSENGTTYAEKCMRLVSDDDAAAANRELQFADRIFSLNDNPFCVPSAAPLWGENSDATPQDDSKHRGLVDLLAAFRRPSEGTVHVLMEYMDMGNMAPFAGEMPATAIAATVRQVLEGLRFMHDDLHCLHRDIKPENLLVNSQGRVAICDFGCAHVGPQGESPVQATEQVGSILYMSPERLLGDPYGPEADVWSLGITVAVMALGHHPFVDTKVARESRERFWALAETIKYTSDDPARCHLATAAAIEVALANADAKLRDFVHACTWQRVSVNNLLTHDFVSSPEALPPTAVVRRYLHDRSFPM